MSAFSILEAVVASAIVGIVFVGVYTGILQSFQITMFSREQERATQLMNEKLEMVRLYTWAQVTNYGANPVYFTNAYYSIGTNSGGANYTGSVTFTSAPFSNGFSPGLRLVTAQVAWLSSSISHTSAISTLVASNGLQNYIYNTNN